MSKKTLNQTNLETLGAAQLAALLMEVSAGSADIKRRLRLELSHHLGVSELAHDVRKRLVSLRKSISYVGWRKRKALIKDLETQVAMIAVKIAPDDPTAAFDLLWQFIEIAPSIYERVDDSKGDVGDVFRAALYHFETIAPRTMVDRAVMADRVWGAIRDNGYGEWDGIIALMSPSLGASGLARLKAHVERYAEAPLAAEPEAHEAIQFLRALRGTDDHAAQSKARFVKWCLQEIAAATGDADAYIAQYSDEDLRRKDVAAEVATLLLADAKAQDGLALLLNAEQDGGDVGQEVWDTAYIACLIAVGRGDDAQTYRWDRFAANLSQTHLRDYLKLLPDFEDVEAEEEAKKLVLEYPVFMVALDFCINAPDLLTAAQLIEVRADEMSGDHYDLLAPAAEALRVRHPCAAVLIWREIVGYILWQGQSVRYEQAADHLADCASLDASIAEYGSFPTHESYLGWLEKQYKHRALFWAKVQP